MSFAEAVFPFANLAVYWWLPCLALLLDYYIGDPPRLPHPVRYIGKLLDRVEPRARHLAASGRLAGLLAVLFVLAVVWASARLVLSFPFGIALVFAVYLAFAGLALGQLLREGNAALELLERNDLPAARAAVGMLVSRDVSASDHDELCRVLAESIAENCNDAFVAPFFWLILGGPVGLWLYKAASTMDSMWGYPYEPWTRFGTAAARLDDILAYIPARLTAFFLICSAVFLDAVTRTRRAQALCSWDGLRRLRRDAGKMKSPNAGWPMAACAWIHGAAMGGKAVYAGKAVDKPILGPWGTEWTTPELRRLLNTVTVAGYCGATVLWASGTAFHLLLP